MTRAFATPRSVSAPNAVMTSTQHASGTDRIAEVARIKGFAADDIVVNLQGDEPMMPAAAIKEVAACAARPAAHRHRNGGRAYPVIGGISRSQLREGTARARRAGAVLQPRAGALAARYRGGPSPRVLPARGGTSASMPTGCAACCNSPRGRRRRSRNAKSSSSCARWNMACRFTWWPVRVAARGRGHARGSGARRAARGARDHAVRVLFVCLGNICRSPTAEGVLRHLLAGRRRNCRSRLILPEPPTTTSAMPPDLRSQRAALRSAASTMSGLRARQIRRRGFRATSISSWRWTAATCASVECHASCALAREVRLIPGIRAGIRACSKCPILTIATRAPSRKCSISAPPRRAACSPPYKKCA